MMVVLFVGPFRKEFASMKEAENAFWVFSVITSGKYGPGWFVQTAPDAAE